MNNKTLIVFCWLLCSVFQTFGQTRFGAKLGGTFSTAGTTETPPEITTETGFQNGIELGLFIEFPISDNLDFHTGVNLTQRGFSENFEYTDTALSFQLESDYALFYLKIPLAFKYDFRVYEEDFFVKIGGFISFGMGGDNEETVRILNNNTNLDFREGDFIRSIEYVSVIDRNNVAEYLLSTDNFLNLVDFGLQFGLGYTLEPMFFEAKFEMSLNSIDPATVFPSLESSYQRYNRSILITAGVYF